jgi:hypothetical protein
MGHENSYQIAIKSLFWPKCWIASYNTQEAICFYVKCTKVRAFDAINEMKWKLGLTRNILSWRIFRRCIRYRKRFQKSEKFKIASFFPSSNSLLQNFWIAGSDQFK